MLFAGGSVNSVHRTVKATDNVSSEQSITY